MTFTELDNALADTGRRSLASRLVFALADGLDKNLSGLNLDDFEKQSGYIRTNIRSVAASLKESGIIEIKYYDDSVPENETIVMGSMRNLQCVLPLTLRSLNGKMISGRSMPDIKTTGSLCSYIFIIREQQVYHPSALSTPAKACPASFSTLC